MKTNGLVAAALLGKELTADESINAVLFGVAFEELDGLRLKIQAIPEEIEETGQRFRSIQVQAVDDFVSVANETLSRFSQRTGEMKDILGQIERRHEELAKQVRSGVDRRPAAPAVAIAAPSTSSALVLALTFGGGTVFGLATFWLASLLVK